MAPLTTRVTVAALAKARERGLEADASVAQAAKEVAVLHTLEVGTLVMTCDMRIASLNH